MKNYLSDGNSKLKASPFRTLGWSIPAYKSCNGFITCPFADKCRDGGCYAQNAFYRMPVVRNALESRLALSRDPWRMINVLDAEVKKRKPDAVRIHDSGDFYSPKYLDAWMQIAKLNPGVIFYAYTKSVRMVKDVNLPPNMVINFSFGGKQDHLIDVERDRHSRVFDTLDDLEAAGYVNASIDDSIAFSSKNNKIGLVYHGPKSKRWVS